MNAPNAPSTRPLNCGDLRAMREKGDKIACLTAYDASFAMLADEAGVDVVLVGDSLGMVLHGRDSTTAVSVGDIVYHSRCVAPMLKRAFLMADLPFLSYATLERALDASQRLMQEGGAKMVKLEGGEEQAAIVEYLSIRGVPVCAHLGLQPQFIHKMGAFKVQGKDAGQAEKMLGDARALVAAGADCLLLECIPSRLAAEIHAAVDVPVIGIGAGPAVDGQILVMHDILGISPMVRHGRTPRFVKPYLVDGRDVAGSFAAYVAEVKSGAYPAAEHSFGTV